MINVYPVQMNYDNGFVIAGHAESAPHGEDLVCAAVSAISQATLIGLEHYSSVDAEVESGLIMVDVRVPDEISHVLIDTMVRALRNISKQYPEYLTVWDERVGTYGERKAERFDATRTT